MRKATGVTTIHLALSCSDTEDAENSKSQRETDGSLNPTPPAPSFNGKEAQSKCLDAM